MEIERIYIACFKHDVRFTRILVSSIRFWYPNLPISLIKDESYGPFHTTDLEKTWQVDIFETEKTKFGWGFGKLEPLFLNKRQRVLILDSDIVMVGPVLDVLGQPTEDFIVTHENPPDRQFVEELYFDLDKLQAIDSAFRYPNYTFNTGQIVATTGLLSRLDFEELVKWQDPPSLKRPDVFRCGEQGVLNYILMKKHATGQISLRRIPFMEVANNPICQQIKISELTSTSPYRFVIHWCGLSRTPSSPTLRTMYRSDILLHFEKLYYSRLPFTYARQFFDIYRYSTESYLRALFRKVRSARSLLGKQSVR
jgi:hypothetical protein